LTKVQDATGANEPEMSSRASNEKAKTVQTVQGLESSRKKQPAMAHNLLAQRVSAALLSVMFLTLSGQNVATAQANKLQGKYGVFIHYLSNTPDTIKPYVSSRPGGLEKDKWDKTVNSFNIPNFVADVKKTGAEYVIFTIGQNSNNESNNYANYASPNKALDEAAAIATGNPQLASGGTITSKTDLVGNIADALKEAGIDFYVYFPQDSIYDEKKSIGADGIERQTGWIALDAIKEYAAKWRGEGKKIDGWFIDGCYRTQAPSRFGTPELAKENTDKLIDAAKTGNPNALVFCNSAALTFRYWSDRQDAIGGEENFFHRLPDPSYALKNDVNDSDQSYEGELKRQILDTDKPLAPLVSGKPQWHVSAPLGTTSGYGSNSLNEFNFFYDQSYLPQYVKKVKTLGGAVTIDIGITAEGSLDEQQLQVMDAVKSHVINNKSLGEIFPSANFANLALGKTAFLKSNNSQLGTLQPERLTTPVGTFFAWSFFGTNSDTNRTDNRRGNQRYLLSNGNQCTNGEPDCTKYEYYSKPDTNQGWNYMVDLEQASEFNQVKVLFRDGNSGSSPGPLPVPEFTVETSNNFEPDGTTIKWDAVDDITEQTSTPETKNAFTVKFKGVIARYVRVSSKDPQMAIKGFEVYNK
jgi:hypothetical protein